MADGFDDTSWYDLGIGFLRKGGAGGQPDWLYQDENVPIFETLSIPKIEDTQANREN